MTDKPPAKSAAAKEAKRRLIAKRYPPRRPPQKLIRVAKAFLAPAFAVAVVIGTAAAGSGDGDWALIIPAQDRICAKSEKDCHAAIAALNNGHWAIGLPRTSEAYCIPYPSCFPAASNTIPGFNAPR